MTKPWDVTSERLLRELAPQVLGAIARRYRDFAAAEDAVQEAMMAAFTLLFALLQLVGMRTEILKRRAEALARRQALQAVGGK